MKNTSIKSWFIFVISVLFALLFVWFGYQLFALAGRDVSSTQLFLLGSASVVAGIFVISNVKAHRVVPSALLVALGLYYFARSADIISGPVLIKILGLASWVAAAVLVYVCYPKDVIPTSTDQQRQ